MIRSALSAIASFAFGFGTLCADEVKPALPGKVSYSKQVLPILQANCLGCHQPAKPRGEFIMTDFAKLVAGGESGKKGVVPRKPSESHLLESVTPDAKGKAYMPEGRKPLDKAEIDLIAKWIAEGAEDDTPSNAKAKYDPEHPPVYTRLPVISSLDYSPDGKLLAVAGFHEVLLWNAEGTKLEGRLVGLSERVQTVKFSPDGTKLAVAGGLQGRTGEVQVWNVENRELKLSQPTTFDTLFGISWSPDGTKLAFGCADNTVRAIDAKTGEQVLFQGSHGDWIVDTCFTNDGQNVVSVSRDRTVKLTELATQRFIDNITSITPGVLKGGLLSVAKHPTREEIVIGGADGQPKVYRVHRLTKRVIGDDANLIRVLPPLAGRVNGLAVSRDGKRIAAVSSLDGKGQISVYGYEFNTELPADIKQIVETVNGGKAGPTKEKLDAYINKDVKRFANIEKLPTALFAVAFHPDNKTIAFAGGDGKIRLIEADTGKAIKEFDSVQIKPATATSVNNGFVSSEVRAAPGKVDFIQDVAPVLSRIGCNAGTCHGSAQGKNGFKLSLRGYDPIFDIRALTDEMASRRVNVASPDDSLMLLKTSGAVPHAGGAVVKPGDKYYQIIREWISQGATLDLKTPRVVGIEVTPKNPTVEKIGGTQPLKVVAKFSDGKTRDVTKEAFLDSGNTEVATVDRGAVMTAVRRGEAPVMARYEGAYAATTLTVMGDRTGFQWNQPESFNRIDELVAAKWKRLKIEPSPVANDSDFLRRVYIDLTGLPPSADEVRAFLADARPAREKREALIDKLVGSKEYVEYWTNKWADLLQVNRKFLGTDGAAAFRAWIRKEIEANTPYDQFVRKVLTSNGSNKENPPASYYKILREPTAIMENTTHLFLAVRFNCNKCHDHPFEKWTQDQYYQTAAFFARVDLKADPAAGAAKIGGTAVEGAKPLYEIVADKKDGEVTHDRTGLPEAPKFPYAAKTEGKADSRRDELAAWITSADNQFFARSYVNRLWGYLFGIGIIEPIDDIRAGNPPTNPELLDYLTAEFLKSGMDARHVIKLIAKSRTYQLAVDTNKWNEDDKINFSHAAARRLPAEVLYDALQKVVGAQSHFPGVKAGTRAAELPDSGIELPDGFLNNLGRPVRESACECERVSSLQLGPVMALINGKTIGDAIAQEGNELSKLVASEKDDRKLVQELFMRIVNRPPTDAQIAGTLKAWNSIDTDHAKLAKVLADYEAELAPVRGRKDAERLAILAKAKADMTAYEKELVPILAKREEERLAKLKTAEDKFGAYIKDYEKNLPKLEKKFKDEVEWTVLDPILPKAMKKGKEVVVLRKLEDKSVAADKAASKLDYTVTAETDLADISAVRLEVMTSDKAPNKGPGFGGGNFVLTQLDVSVGPKGKDLIKQTLKNALADFSQDNFPIAGAVDNSPNGGKGWAVSPAVGVGHWATFDLEKPVAIEGTKTFSFKLTQNFTGVNHNIARFRISVASLKKPAGLGVSGEWSEILKTPVDKRTPEQKAATLKYFTATDKGYRDSKAALEMAKGPLPIDPKLKEMKDGIASLEKPLPPDAKLEQLKADTATSAKQLTEKRLTGAQDLAWALINSPAFLFNR